MGHFEPSPPDVRTIPAADVLATTGTGGPVVHQAFPVRRPEADRNEFLVQVRASTLHRCRGRLREPAANPFPWHEAALGISTLSFGAFLGALPAALVLNSRSGIFFYNVLPAVGVGAGVAFAFLRRRVTIDAASEALRDLPDPDETR